MALLHLPSTLRDPFLTLADAIGFEADQLLFAFLGLAGIPVGYIHSLIPFNSPAFVTLRHFYSIVFGLLWMWLLIGPTSVLAVACPFVIYVITVYLPPEQAPLVSTLFGLGFLSICHMHRLITAYLTWRMDYTMPLMISIVKAIMFSFVYCDGVKLSKGQRIHAKDHLQEELKKRVIFKIPSLFEFLSFICFYGAVLCGPSFGIKHYLSFQEGSLFTSVCVFLFFFNHSRIFGNLCFRLDFNQLRARSPLL